MQINPTVAIKDNTKIDITFSTFMGSIFPNLKIQMDKIRRKLPITLTYLDFISLCLIGSHKGIKPLWEPIKLSNFKSSVHINSSM